MRLSAILILALIPTLLKAQTTTWNSSPVDSNFNNPSNWSAGVPNSPSTTALFGQSSVTTGIVQQAHTISVSAFQFNNGAPAYSFSVNGGTIGTNTFNSLITLTGAGIVNSSSNRQFFDIDFNEGEGATFGSMVFQNSATADNSIFVNRDNLNATATVVRPVLLGFPPVIIWFFRMMLLLQTRLFSMRRVLDPWLLRTTRPLKMP